MSSLYIDQETQQKLIARDPALLHALFIEINPFLLRLCLSNRIYKENSEEVIHQTWETFFQNLDKYEGRSQIRTFICGILFNKIREHRRSQSRTLYEEDSEKVLNHAFTADGWWKVSPQDPFKAIELKQSAQLIKDCIEGLSDQQKTAFVLREVEEENSDEICNLLGVTVSHLRVLLFRAKEKLRICMEGKIRTETI